MACNDERGLPVRMTSCIRICGKNGPGMLNPPETRVVLKLKPDLSVHGGPFLEVTPSRCLPRHFGNGLDLKDSRQGDRHRLLSLRDLEVVS
jgi:hypothetical protein